MTPKAMITDMLEELTAIARTIKVRIYDGCHFGMRFHDLAEKTLLDIYAAMRRLKITRTKYKAIPKAELSDQEIIRNKLMRSRDINRMKEEEAAIQADRSYSPDPSLLPEPAEIPNPIPQSQSADRYRQEAPRRHLEVKQ